MIGRYLLLSGTLLCCSPAETPRSEVATAAAPRARTAHGEFGGSSSAQSAGQQKEELKRLAVRNPAMRNLLMESSPERLEFASKLEIAQECPTRDSQELVWCRVPQELANLNPLMPYVRDVGICRRGACISSLQCADECSASVAVDAKSWVMKRKKACAELQGSEEQAKCLEVMVSPGSAQIEQGTEAILLCMQKCGFVAKKYREVFGPKQSERKPESTEGADHGH